MLPNNEAQSSQEFAPTDLKESKQAKSVLLSASSLQRSLRTGKLYSISSLLLTLALKS